MTTKEQLAEWIEVGIARHDVKENRLVFLARGQRGVMACALGYALVGKYGDPRKALKLYEKKVGRMRGGCCKEAVAALLKVPFELVKTINWLHLSGVRATQITKRLRSGEL